MLPCGVKSPSKQIETGMLKTEAASFIKPGFRGKVALEIVDMLGGYLLKPGMPIGNIVDIAIGEYQKSRYINQQTPEAKEDGER